MASFSRREVLGGVLSLALQPVIQRNLHAAEQSGFYYRDYSKCLPDYLSGLAREAYQKRNSELLLLTNPEMIQRRQAWVRATFWKLVGECPSGRR